MSANEVDEGGNLPVHEGGRHLHRNVDGLVPSSVTNVGIIAIIFIICIIVAVGDASDDAAVIIG